MFSATRDHHHHPRLSRASTQPGLAARRLQQRAQTPSLKLARRYNSKAYVLVSVLKTTTNDVFLPRSGAAISASGGSAAYAGIGNVFGGFDSSTTANVTAPSRRPASASAAVPTTVSLDRGGIGAGRNPALSVGAGGGRSGGGGALYTSSVGGGEAARAAMGWGASTGSKAVLSALRSLQDKIRK